MDQNLAKNCLVSIPVPKTHENVVQSSFAIELSRVITAEFSEVSVWGLYNMRDSYTSTLLSIDF